MDNLIPGKNRNGDLPDSKKDQEKLKPEVTTIDLPEVKDIPGQENVRVPNIREMQDETASSADEEAEELLRDVNSGEDEEDAPAGTADVTEDEKKLLRRGAGHPRTDENRDLGAMSLDTRDDEGDLLNEKNQSEDRFGEDLDIPGSELDDDDEDIGEEDEENNQYSSRD
jgi:hypothetical protein